MALKKFTAANMREAMDLVRHELGDEAIIVDTHSRREAGATGVPTAWVEVWAQTPGDGLPPELPIPLEEVSASLPAPVEPLIATPLEAEPGTGTLGALRQQLDTVHAQLATISDGLHWLGMGGWHPQAEFGQFLADAISHRIPVSGGIRFEDAPRLVALIGPSGVGKTTALLKLAWLYGIMEGRRVGVVGMDTIRMGARQELETYCRHLEAPLEIVYTPEDLPGALSRLVDCALVLIDTPGCHPRDAARVALLQDLLGAADPDEVHLVVSAGSSTGLLRDLLQGSDPLHPDQVLITKLDEAPTPLELLPLLAHSGLAVSYLSAGPQVHADLLVASSEVMAHLVQ